MSKSRKESTLTLITALSLSLGAMALSSCSFETYQLQGNEVVLHNDNKFKQSTPFGNFVATAIQKSNDLDVVLYPTHLLNDNTTVLVKENMTDEEIHQVTLEVKDGPEDQMLIGTMKGSDLKDFIKRRSTEEYQVALQTAGLWYGLTFEGGFQRMPNFSWGNGKLKVEDDRLYKVAVSNYFYFSGAFPGYKYRNGFNFSFKSEAEMVSVRKSIKNYLSSSPTFPYWNRLRASVLRKERGSAGFKKISELQGTTHISPYYAQKVSTEGIVTAVGSIQWFPYGIDIYIQSTQPDKNDLTSEGLHVFLENYQHTVKLGETISVSGTLYEDFRTNKMSQTSLREVTDLQILKKGRL